MLWTEHFLTRSAAPERADDYENCYLCCRRCNTARGARPRALPEGKLLDPCEVAWGDHFDLAADRTWRVRKPGRADAEETFKAYNLGDDLKQECRAARRKMLKEAWEVIEIAEEMADELSPDDPEHHAKARRVRKLRTLAMSTLQSFAAIPDDNPRACLCGRTDARTLPTWLDDQCREVELR